MNDNQEASVLTQEQRKIHEWGLRASANYRKSESELIEVLQAADRTRLFREMNCSSLYKYAVEVLRLGEATALSLIAIARKSVEVSPLKSAGLSVARASRIVSVITVENAAELIAFAKTHTLREIDFEVARRNPQAAVRERVRPINEDTAELKISISKSLLKKLMRVQALEAQSGAHGNAMARAIEAAVDKYLFHEDPVEKAKRAERRSTASASRTNPTAKPDEKLCAHRVRRVRMKLKAGQKHDVFARDGGCCQYRDESGHVCGSDRWVEVHHIKPVSEGGTNDPENLITLCSYHHGRVHHLR